MRQDGRTSDISQKLEEELAISRERSKKVLEGARAIAEEKEEKLKFMEKIEERRESPSPESRTRISDTSSLSMTLGPADHKVKRNRISPPSDAASKRLGYLAEHLQEMRNWGLESVSRNLRANATLVENGPGESVGDTLYEVTSRVANRLNTKARNIASHLTHGNNYSSHEEFIEDYVTALTATPTELINDTLKGTEVSIEETSPSTFAFLSEDLPLDEVLRTEYDESPELERAREEMAVHEGYGGLIDEDKEVEREGSQWLPPQASGLERRQRLFQDFYGSEETQE